MRRALSRSAAALLCLALLTSPGSARAELDAHVSRTWPIALTGLAIWLGSEHYKADLAPAACHWCEPGGFDTSIRKHLLWSDQEKAAKISDRLLIASAPLALGLGALAAAHEQRFHQRFLEDSLVIAEATVLSADVNQLVKLSVGRQRPCAHFGTGCGGSNGGSDQNLSFYSGHTAVTFALAASSGTVASMRGYRWAPWVWASGLTLAATTGYLRIAADRHYATDVLTGALFGTAIGIGVPRLLHSMNVSGSAGKGGFELNLAFRI